MPSPFSWLQYHFGTQPGNRLPSWAQILPGPAGVTARILNNAASARSANPDWASNAASAGSPGFDPSSLETPAPQYGEGQIPGGIDIAGNSPQSSGGFPDFLKDFLSTIGRPDYVSSNPAGEARAPTTSVPYAPGSFPLPGGGNPANAAGDWRENAMRSFNPFTGAGSHNWLSEPRGFFGAQTVSGLPEWSGFGSVGGGGPWRTLLA